MLKKIDTNKKILFISSWAPPQVGGPSCLYYLLNEIDSSRYNIITSNKIFKGICNSLKLECRYYYFEEGCKNFIFLKFFGKLIKFYYSVKKTISVVCETNADLLVGVSDSGKALFITLFTSLITKKKYVLYMFDLYHGNNFGWKKNLISSLFEYILFRRATLIIVTNDMTKNYYIAKYQFCTNVFVKVVYNISPKIPIDTIDSKSSKKIDIVYTGGVYWPQYESLMQMIDLVSNDTDVSNLCNLKIFTFKGSILADDQITCDNVDVSYCDSQDIYKVQQNADILFLPMTWVSAGIDIIKTATPAKLSDYLRVARPILVYAPDYAAVSCYLSKNNAAQIVSIQSKELLKKILLELCFDFNRRNIISKNAYDLYLRNHTPLSNAQSFVKIINDI